jgi:hypothetical protein
MVIAFVKENDSYGCVGQHLGCAQAAKARSNNYRSGRFAFSFGEERVVIN